MNIYFNHINIFNNVYVYYIFLNFFKNNAFFVSLRHHQYSVYFHKIHDIICIFACEADNYSLTNLLKWVVPRCPFNWYANIWQAEKIVRSEKIKF